MRIRRRPSLPASQGQVLVVFVMAIFVVMGMVAIVIDVTWYWTNSLRVQRAADAAALAGVVYLPGDVPRATAAALAESTKNGYTNTAPNPPATCPTGATCIYPNQDPANPRRMQVRISTPVGTFFMRVFGITSITAARNSEAEYVLPVPMGSPQNYYGVYGRLRTPSNPTGTQMTLSDGSTPTNQGFWGTMISQGATLTNGDIFLAKYNYDASGSPTTTANTNYKPSTYYDYGIEMAPGSTGGSVRIFDPVFCATDTDGGFGTGDRWFSGTSATSAFYDLYDTNNTPYDLTDDFLVATARATADAVGVSGTFFRRVRAADSTLFSPASSAPSGVPTCTQGASGITSSDPRYYHNRWYQLPFQPGKSMYGFDDSGNPAPRVYRLRTTSTDPASPNDQDSSNGHNSFSIEAQATGTDPNVYGYGTMEAFSPLPQAQASTFFLAQIAAVHAGKTVTIDLWDPGDTGSLSANLEILEPVTNSALTPCAGASACWLPTKFSYTAERLGTGGSSCNSLTGNLVTSVTTNTGGTSRFNGCWLHITIKLAAGYNAPIPDASQWPPDLPASARGPGWWRIRYNMGSGSGNAFDLTTWQVGIRGNPVHLLVP